MIFLRKIAFWKRPWWDPFWYAVDTPEVGDTAYMRGLLFVGHFGLGMLFCALISVAWSAALLPVIYSAILFSVLPVIFNKLKEDGDIERGGTPFDGNEDTLGIAIACWAYCAFIVANIIVASGVISIGAVYIIYILDRQLKREFFG